jgi:hypothetical protein
MVEDDVMDVCCETVVACVELEVCDCLFSGLIFVVFPCSFNVKTRSKVKKYVI